MHFALDYGYEDGYMNIALLSAHVVALLNYSSVFKDIKSKQGQPQTADLKLGQAHCLIPLRAPTLDRLTRNHQK